jgi:hypothetical protein
MTRSAYLFSDILDVAAAIRAEGTSARFVSVTADAGRVHCAVTTGSNRSPDAVPVPHRARHPLFGAALQEAAAGVARELINRRLGSFTELGGRGLVTISAAGAMHIDLTLADGTRLREGVDLDRLRGSALSHTTNRAVCLASALSDDIRFPAWNASEQVQRDWIAAAKEIDPQSGPDQRGIRSASDLILRSFRPMGLTQSDVVTRIRTGFYPDLIAPVNPDGPVPDRPEGLGTAPAWLPLDPLEAERLHLALESSSDPVLSRVLGKLRSVLEDVGADEAFRSAVIEKYAGRLTDGDVDFQPDGMVSKSDEGAYVMAFLWVTNAEAGFRDPEEETEADPTP